MFNVSGNSVVMRKILSHKYNHGYESRDYFKSISVYRETRLM